MRKLAVIISVILLTAACNSTGGKQIDLSSVENHIHEMNKTYGNRFISNDTSFYNDRYCKDIIIMPEQMPQISGRDSVRLFNYNDGKNKELKIVVKATQIYGGPEVIVEEGTYEFPDEKGEVFEKGKFIALWKQENGKWKLFREIWNRNNVPVNN